MKFYVGATRQNDGKTLTCIGLISALRKRFARIGYIKPIGQRYVELDGYKIDEDAVLVKAVYGLPMALPDMSPVAIPRKFTEGYIDSPNREDLLDAITTAFTNVRNASDVIVVEGTGHAGVGSVFDMSNGDVAALLGCKVVVVSSGGIGRPIDEIMLNKAMFDAAGVRILGAVINKVEDEKYQKVKSYVTRGLARKGVEVLGVMPFKPMLSSPTVTQLFEDIQGQVVTAGERALRMVSKMIIGAMMPSQALEYIDQGTLLITPGSRDDIILAAMSSSIMGDSLEPNVAGLVLTGPVSPPPNIMNLLKRSMIPLMLVPDDTFSVASRIAKLIVKIRPSDKEKIRYAEHMVEEYVDIDRILDIVAGN